jgi:hypothetical protein
MPLLQAVAAILLIIGSLLVWRALSLADSRVRPGRLSRRGGPRLVVPSGAGKARENHPQNWREAA